MKKRFTKGLALIISISLAASDVMPVLAQEEIMHKDVEVATSSDESATYDGNDEVYCDEEGATNGVLLSEEDGKTVLSESSKARITNRNGQDYVTYGDVISSHLLKINENTFMQVQAKIDDVDGYLVQYFDKDMNWKSGYIVAEELPIWGGFTTDGNNYYVLSGDYNLEESNTKETYRITKYDLEWNRISAASIYGGNTTTPFIAGCTHFAWYGTDLIANTSREMYTYTDGNRHQSNIIIALNPATMKISARTGDSAGYVSHSFNQFVAINGTKIVTVDQADGYPIRSIYLQDFTYKTGATAVPTQNSNVTIKQIAGEDGENEMGISIGGLTVGSNNYIVAYNSVPDGTAVSDFDEAERNIYLSFVNISNKSVKNVQITNDAVQNGTYSTPHLVEANGNSYLLTSRGGIVYFGLVDEQNKTCELHEMEGFLSDCVPVFDGKKFIWYVYSNSSEAVFYYVDINSMTGGAYNDASAKYPCGENVTWSFSKNGTLTISGSGEMNGYYVYDESPWYDVAPFVRNIVIEDGVTNLIGTNFWACENVEKVTIAKSVTKIKYTENLNIIGEKTAGPIGGNYAIEFGWDSEIPQNAFDGDTDLKSIVIPEGITKIGDYAFYKCSNLSSVSLPESLEEIGSSVFSYCTSLKELRFGHNVNDISKWSNDNSGLEKVYGYSGSYVKAFYKKYFPEVEFCPLDAENVEWSLTDGMLNITGSGKMDYFIAEKDVPYYTNRYAVRKIEVGEGVTTISKYAFTQYSYAGTIKLPKSIKEIADKDVFRKDVLLYCYADSVAEAYAIENGISYILLKADGSLPDVMWSGSDTLNSYFEWEIDNNGTLTISGEGEIIGDSSNWQNPLCINEIKRVIIQPGITGIDAKAFYNCSAIESISLPDTLVNIGTRAFAGCTSLTELTIPESVTSITDAFYDSSIRKIYAYSGSYAESYVKRRIEFDCAGITFESLDVNTVSWNLENGVIRISGEGKMFYYESQTLVPYYNKVNEVKEIFIEDGLKSISRYAFAKFYWAEKITIPRSVTFIADVDVFSPDRAIIYCYENSTAEAYAQEHNLRYVVLNDDGSLPDILWQGKDDQISWTYSKDGVLTLSGTGAMKDYSYGGVENIAPWNEYPINSGVKKVVVEEGITYLGSYILSDCGNVQELVLPESLEDADILVLSGRYKLTPVIYYPGDEEAFRKMPIAEDIFIPRASEIHYNYCKVTGAEHVRKTIKGKEATCAEAGFTEKVICENCEKVFSKVDEIPATGEHVWGVGTEIVSANCTTKGQIQYKCKNCKETRNEETDFDFTKHLYGEDVVSWDFEQKSCTITAECTREGCSASNNNHKKEQVLTEANGLIVEVKEATCAEEGSIKLTSTYSWDQGEPVTVSKEQTLAVSTENHLFGTPEIVENGTCITKQKIREVCTREGCQGAKVVDGVRHPYERIVNGDYDTTRHENLEIIFDSLGGTNCEAMQVDCKVEVGTLPTPELEGYRFLGWTYEVNGDELVKADSTFAVNTTLYAKWEKISEGLKVVLQNPDEEYFYTGAAITPEVLVTNNGIELTKDVDYTVSYKNNVNASTGSTKKPSIIITGKGAFAGSQSTTFEISQREISEVSVGNTSVVAGKKAAPILIFGGKKLGSKDYTCDELKSVVTADKQVLVYGKGNFCGSVEVNLHAVSPAELLKFSVVSNTATVTYTGTENYPDIKVKDAVSGDTLTEGTDYTVSYAGDLINAGTVKYTIIGTGAYTGNVTKSFKILPLKTSMQVDTTKVQREYDFVNAPITVSDSIDIYSPAGEKLVLGRDYTISYKNNVNVGTAKYTISYKNNYKGSPNYVGTYAIKAMDLENADTEIYVGDVNYTGKAGAYASKVYLSINGTYVKDSDYNVFYYADENMTKETKVKANYITLNADEEKTIYVKVVGKGKNLSNLGSITTTYQVINHSVIDLSTAQISIFDETGKKTTKLEYTGTAVCPKVVVECKVSGIKQVLDASEYDVEYFDNIQKGKATIVVMSNGATTVGSKKVNVSIVSKNLKTLAELLKDLFN